MDYKPPKQDLGGLISGHPGINFLYSSRRGILLCIQFSSGFDGIVLKIIPHMRNTKVSGCVSDDKGFCAVLVLLEEGRGVDAGTVMGPLAKSINGADLDAIWHFRPNKDNESVDVIRESKCSINRPMLNGDLLSLEQTSNFSSEARPASAESFKR